MGTVTIQIYTVLAVHPAKGIAYDVELIATSEAAAIARTRGILFHRDRDVEWLHGQFTVTNIVLHVSGQQRS